MTCNTILVDARNIDQYKSILIDKVSRAPLTGLDIETEDSQAHEGIIQFRKGQKHAFDWNKMVVTGISFYSALPEEEEIAYYVNLNHADVENRVPFETVEEILDSKPDTSSWICHNAPFEITVMRNTYGYLLKNVICTLQMAVSAYGPDEYEKDKFIGAKFGDMKVLFPEAEIAFSELATSMATAKEAGDEDDKTVQRRRTTWQQQEIINKILGKSSRATFSYNGFIDSIRYGYGLKEAVKSFFDHTMTTYEEVLGDKEHMGQLTGEEVSSYGAEDAYWAVKLFFRLYQFMEETNPKVIDTFFTQENPMIYVYSDVRQQGIQINLSAVDNRRNEERIFFAQGLRELKATAKKLLPFPEELNERLVKYEKWYADEDKTTKQPKALKHRKRLEEWILSPDCEDDAAQCMQVSSSVTTGWTGATKNINIGYYYQSRLFMYDLCRAVPILYKGKVQSDADARGSLKERFEHQMEDAKEKGDTKTEEWLKLCIELLDRLSALTNVETRMKLYLNPYMLLTDPETKRMYPEISSMLATRRMAGSNPNPMQLAKRGDSTYVRGFYNPEKDHVFIAPDWSQIELVLIGEFSGDPGFKEAFGQTPYQDLHLGAAADVLSVVIDGVTADLLKGMHKMDIADIPPKLLVKPNGEALSPSAAKKFWRTEVGKGSNFNYWYSGALSTVGEKLGWTSDQMWAATEAYRNRFAVAEAWRTGLIEQAKWDGFVQLPDGHRRVRWEITHEWATMAARIFESFGLEGVRQLSQHIIRGIRTRAGNQLVNAMIQGSCATLAKRSILSINEEIKSAGFDAHFKIPVHDELVFSVNRHEVIDFNHMIRNKMATHPDIIRNLKIDCSVAMGKTFEPFKPELFPNCLIELDEAPDILGFEEGSRLNDDQIREALDFMFREVA